VDGSGDVYVGDWAFVQKFAGDGTYLTALGTGATGVAVDGSGNVYVSEGLNSNSHNFGDRIEKFAGCL